MSQGMNDILAAMARAEETGELDKTERAQKLEAFLMDLRDIYTKHLPTLNDAEIIFKSNICFMALVLKKSMPQAFAALLALDLAGIFMNEVTKKETKSS